MPLKLGQQNGSFFTNHHETFSEMEVLNLISGLFRGVGIPLSRIYTACHRISYLHFRYQRNVW